MVDYTIKKIEKLMEPDSFMIKDLDKFNLRIKRQEEKLRKIIEKIERLEDRVRRLERENIFEKPESSSESE